jgi:hypothetical protein
LASYIIPIKVYASNYPILVASDAIPLTHFPSRKPVSRIFPSQPTLFYEKNGQRKSLLSNKKLGLATIVYAR